MSQVLACLDGSASAEIVCDYAAWAAERLSAPLTLLHVLDETRYPSRPNLSGNLGFGAEALQRELSELDRQRNQLALAQGQSVLEEAKARLADLPLPAPALRQRHGDLVECLRELEPETRLLVIGKQGEAHLAPGAVIGDNVERVVRGVHRPVLIAAGVFRVPRTVMLAFDGSPTMDKGVELIAGSPLFRDLCCHLVTVGDHDEAVRAAAEQLRASGLQVEVAMRDGDVVQALHEYRTRHRIDLVVMGAYGHSRIREFLVGSVTNALIRGAEVPHLILR